MVIAVYSAVTQGDFQSLGYVITFATRTRKVPA
jgi:hypothetical protein